MVWFFYPLLPWLGVMALGYGMGWIFLSPNRDRLAMTIGAVMIALFLVIRYTNAFGDPKPWMYVDGGRTWMKFLDVQKYPPSLLYVLMTLGPTLLLVPIYERLRGVVADTLRTFGSVPFIAYVAHIYVLHALVIV